MPLPCLASQGAVATCSACSSCAGLFWFYSYFAVPAFHCFGLLQSLLYSAYFAVHAGIACLHCVCWDSMLTSLACDWPFGYVTACCNSMSGFPGV